MAEFDLLRAQVARDTQRPEVIRRRNARDLAYLRLETAARAAAGHAAAARRRRSRSPCCRRRRRSWPRRLPPPKLAQRVRACAPRSPRPATTSQQREAGVRVARAQRLPSVSVSSAYGRVAYPSGCRDSATSAPTGRLARRRQVPIFTGGRIKADETDGARRSRRDARRGCSRRGSCHARRGVDPARARRTPAPPGKRPPASSSRRSAPTRSPSCATAKGCRRSSSCRMRGCCCSRRRTSARRRRATCSWRACGSRCCPICRFGWRRFARLRRAQAPQPAAATTPAARLRPRRRQRARVATGMTTESTSRRTRSAVQRFTTADWHPPNGEMPRQSRVASDCSRTAIGRRAAAARCDAHRLDRRLQEGPPPSGARRRRWPSRSAPRTSPW